MEELRDFENLTIREILVKILGEKDASEILMAIRQGIQDGLTGDELNKLIYQTLCRLKVTKIEAYQLLHITGPQITEPTQITR